MIQDRISLGAELSVPLPIAPRAPAAREGRAVMFLDDPALSMRRSAMPHRAAQRPVHHTLHRALRLLLSPPSLVQGVDRHLGDPALALRAQAARAMLLVLPPMGNLTNGFYAVHPRRNDRFLRARAPLLALYPEIDFATFAFTGELLSTLAATCPVRFLDMRRDLACQWLARMEQLLARLPSQGLLLEPPAAPWLARPALPHCPGLHRVAIDPDDLSASVAALLRASRHRA